MRPPVTFLQAPLFPCWTRKERGNAHCYSMPRWSTAILEKNRAKRKSLSWVHHWENLRPGVQPPIWVRFVFSCSPKELDIKITESSTITEQQTVSATFTWPALIQQLGLKTVQCSKSNDSLVWRRCSNRSRAFDQEVLKLLVIQWCPHSAKEEIRDWCSQHSTLVLRCKSRQCFGSTSPTFTGHWVANP